MCRRARKHTPCPRTRRWVDDNLRQLSIGNLDDWHVITYCSYRRSSRGLGFAVRQIALAQGNEIGARHLTGESVRQPAIRELSWKAHNIGQHDDSFQLCTLLQFHELRDSPRIRNTTGFHNDTIWRRG